tara:strand:- start:944 stop:2053 length:1110 start_codon:yes stop_codon:yes gene_type:complete
MNVCIIGNGLISLSLAKALINNNFKVNIYAKTNNKIKSLNRTVGITPSNLNFFQKEILKIRKSLIWDINNIEIYNDENKKNKVLDFNDSSKTLFSIIKNEDLINLLNSSLKKNKNFKRIIIKNKFFYKKIIENKKYDLIINCDQNNEIYKKYFYRKILKNYESTAYASIINHKKTNNKKAVQIFTKLGPIAFLPVSESQTSIVYSIKNKSINNNSHLLQNEFENLVYKNNKIYKINSINNFESFLLKAKILKKYYNKNILAFGEILHQIHPLSGQGFNMTLRDISALLDLIRDKKNLGLGVNSSIFKEFENKTKHLNFIFSSGNDFIYEFFNKENFYLKLFSDKIINYLNKNRLFNKLAIKYADKGIFF